LRILIVKTSSIGDVIHTLPAVTDAARVFPGLACDWVVETGLQEIPGWHPAVDRTLVVGLREWRRQPRRAGLTAGVRGFLTALRDRRYDAVIDAQGLYKSAVIALAARGARHGLDFASAREPAVAATYRRRHRVPRDRHAIARVRALFAGALGYSAPDDLPDYGLDRAAFAAAAEISEPLVFLHGTSWPTKLWPVARWRALARLAGEAGLRVGLPWHGAEDRARAMAIADGLPAVRPIETPTLGDAARLIAAARAAVAVDTGLGHLAAALGVPALSLYGPTAPDLVGTCGAHQEHVVSARFCAPCRSRSCPYADVAQTPPPCLADMAEEAVWRRLQALIAAPAPAIRAAQ
jgi:heptosyltransferase-1